VKLIHCDKCDDVVKLTFTMKECSCGNIAGKYLKDGRTAEIHLKDYESLKTTRVLGFPNSVRYNKIREGTCWKFHWYDPYLWIWIKGIRQHFIPSEQHVDIENTAEEDAKNSMKEFMQSFNLL
jgi:hypothetical protein